jgi:hypothetical protein
MKSIQDLKSEARRQIDELRKHNERFRTTHRSYQKRESAPGVWQDVDVTDETIRRNEALIDTLEGLIADYGGK